MMPSHPATITRRRFVQGSLAAGAAAMVVSSSALRTYAANEKLAFALVGAGGRGADNLNDLKATRAVHIAALADPDAARAADTFAAHPDARRFADWRKMLEAMANSIDAVVVSTPDHNHAVVSVAAMKLGKHVYCEKPLARSIFEAREMARVAAERKVVTQMGTQGHAFEGTRSAVEAVRGGAIGEVRELHVWTDRPKQWWPQGVERPRETPPVPRTLAWDVWLGPAPARPYHPAYVPFAWRGFWDFGTGAIGDMGIHNLDTAFWALGLTAPTSAKVVDCSPALTEASAKETAPAWSIIELQFPARGDKPPVKLTWYDGGKLPPAELFHGERVPKADGGSLLIGGKGSLLTRTWHGGQDERDMFLLLPRKQFEGHVPPTRTIPRVASHHHEWVEACRGKGATLSNFGYAATLTESLLVGNLALRAAGDVEWDAKAMRATNRPAADAFVRPAFREGWSL